MGDTRRLKLIDMKNKKQNASTYKDYYMGLNFKIRSLENTNFVISRKKTPYKWFKPIWHAPWKCYRIITGHLGWVRAVAFDSTNEWFCTGSSDRTIKIWDVTSGELKLTLTGHIEQVTSLAVPLSSVYVLIR